MIGALYTTTLIWAAGLLAYGLLLRPVAAHGFRRAYLLAVAGIGAVLPWLPVPRPDVAFLPAAPRLDRVWLQEVVVTAEGAAEPTLGVQPLVLLYAIGLAIALIIGLLGVWRLVRCFGESRPVASGHALGMDVRETQFADGPFSFGRTLFVPNWAGVPERERTTLLQHELAHYRLGHRFDNLAMAALCTVAYFHPLAHLLRRELRLVHEYQADRAALATTKVGDYRRQLLAQTFNTTPSTLAAAFAQRPLKSRFAMMTQHFHPRQSWRLLTAAACLTLAAVACTEDGIDQDQLTELDAAQSEGLTAEELFMNGQKRGEIVSVDTVLIQDSETGQITKTYVQRYRAAEGDIQTMATSDGHKASQMVRGQEVFRVVEDMPHFKGAGCADSEQQCNQRAMLAHIYSNFKYPASAKDDGVEGKVIVQFVVGTDGAILEPSVVRSPDDALSEEVLRIVREMPEWAPGRQDGEDVQVSFVLPVQFRLS